MSNRTWFLYMSVGLLLASYVWTWQHRLVDAILGFVLSAVFAHYGFKANPEGGK